jgi:hypothetical protein
MSHGDFFGIYLIANIQYDIILIQQIEYRIQNTEDFEINKAKGENESRTGVYSCEFLVSWLWPVLKKQTQFFRSEFSVLPTAKTKLKKQSQFWSG